MTAIHIELMVKAMAMVRIMGVGDVIDAKNLTIKRCAKRCHHAMAAFQPFGKGRKGIGGKPQRLRAKMSDNLNHVKIYVRILNLFLLVIFWLCAINYDEMIAIISSYSLKIT